MDSTRLLERLRGFWTPLGWNTAINVYSEDQKCWTSPATTRYWTLNSSSGRWSLRAHEKLCLPSNSAQKRCSNQLFPISKSLEGFRNLELKRETQSFRKNLSPLQVNCFVVVKRWDQFALAWLECILNWVFCNHCTSVKPHHTSSFFFAWYASVSRSPDNCCSLFLWYVARTIMNNSLRFKLSPRQLNKFRISTSALKTSIFGV